MHWVKKLLKNRKIAKIDFSVLRPKDDDVIIFGQIFFLDFEKNVLKSYFGRQETSQKAKKSYQTPPTDPLGKTRPSQTPFYKKDGKKWGILCAHGGTGDK